MLHKIIKIGTRGSNLALTQSKGVEKRLRALGYSTELIVIKTTGDKILDKPLYDIGGKALFLKELEEALLKGEIDMAVHSMKDVPGEMPDSLIISATLEREIPNDVFISNYPSLKDLPKNAKVGTCSVRRIIQAKLVNPDIEICMLRGNVDSRIKKFDNNEYDAIILAAAGIKRLGLWRESFKILPKDIFLPAVGQGAIGIEIRKNDDFLLEVSDKLNHINTWQEIQAERGFLETLKGDCRTPMAAFAKKDGENITADFLLTEIDGTNIRKTTLTGKAINAYLIGEEAAKLFKS